ncbi:MAG TPA: phosphoribosylglycinamide formyltransferase, partial [Candidatus Lokiarchaeia archaeon]|nr:phosphoribosylglycinamide formyltransferase [Candidatus Lokiarchaeia archaeon]
MSQTKIGIIASGSGSNAEAIMEACESGILNGLAEVVTLICNKNGAYCLERAQNHGIPCILIESEGFDGTREEFDRRLVAELTSAGVNVVCLAGYMRLVSNYFLQQFPGAVMNIHPALLPAFPGMHAHQDAIAYGVKVSGCTVHFVDEDTDHGPIIIQKAVPVYDDDTEETLGERVLQFEHKIYPQ